MAKREGVSRAGPGLAGLPVAALFVAALLVGTGPVRSAERGRPAAPAPAPAPAPSLDPDVTLLLVGDGGEPRAGGEPVLAALAREAAAAPARSVVVFLGDNVYPKGIPPEGDPGYTEALRRLGDQVRAATAGGARAIFVPGNHDWELGGPGGLAAVGREEVLVASLGAGRARLLPTAGGPGPAVVDLGTTVRLVALDTQWWLHPAERGEGSAAGASAALGEALAGAAGRRTVVVSHHPLRSGGPHGTLPGLLDHLFPLRHVATWAWLPLPGIGSAYPVWRASWGSPQDMPSPAYRALRADLLSAFRRARPLVHAAGHDHSLQLLRGDAAAGEAEWEVVSGTGWAGGENPVRRLPETLFARSVPGFVRVDAFAGGRVEVRVLVVSKAKCREAFLLRLG